MRFHPFYATLAYVSLSAAVKVTYTGGNYNNVVAGEPFIITWIDASGSVTIILNTGFVDLIAVETIVSEAGATGTSYTWTPSSTLASDVYTIEIEDDSSVDDSVGFEIKSGSNVQSSPASAIEATSVGVIESSSTANVVSSTATQPPAQTITQTILSTPTQETLPSAASPTLSLSAGSLSSHSLATSSSQSLSNTSPSTSATSQSSSSTFTSKSQSLSSSSQSAITSSQFAGSTSTPISPTSSSQSPTPTSQSIQNTHKSLLKAAKAGIAIGVILGLIVIGIVFWFGRKSAKTKPTEASATTAIELGAGVLRNNRLELEAPLNEEERVELGNRRRAAELAGIQNFRRQHVVEEIVNAERAELEALRRTVIYEI